RFLRLLQRNPLPDVIGPTPVEESDHQVLLVGRGRGVTTTRLSYTEYFGYHLVEASLLVFVPPHTPHAQLHAPIADEHGRAGNQLLDLVLTLAAERAIERLRVESVAQSKSLLKDSEGFLDFFWITLKKVLRGFLWINFASDCGSPSAKPSTFCSRMICVSGIQRSVTPRLRPREQL